MEKVGGKVSSPFIFFRAEEFKIQMGPVGYNSRGRKGIFPSNYVRLLVTIILLDLSDLL